jgi:hypothetical protein
VVAVVDDGEDWLSLLLAGRGRFLGLEALVLVVVFLTEE